MDENTKTRIEHYLAVHAAVSRLVKDPAVVSALIDQIGKDERCAMLSRGEWSNGEPNGNGSVDQPATKKQLDFMRDLGLEVPANVTKRRASELIDEARAMAA